MILNIQKNYEKNIKKTKLKLIYLNITIMFKRKYLEFIILIIKNISQNVSDNFKRILSNYTLPRRISADAKRILYRMLEIDCSKRQRFIEISQDDWLWEHSEFDRLQENKRRNYQLKRVYTKTRTSKILKTEIANKNETNNDDD